MLATYLPVGSIISYGFYIGAIQEKKFLSIIIGGDHILINDIPCTCKVICKIYRYEWWWANVKLNVIFILYHPFNEDYKLSN